MSLNKQNPQTVINPTEFNSLEQALTAINAEARAVAGTSIALQVVIFYNQPSDGKVTVQGMVEQKPGAFATHPSQGEAPVVAIVPEQDGEG